MDTLNRIRADLLGKLEVRKTWAQKSDFIEWVLAYASGMGVKAVVEEGGKHVRSRNVVFGDAEKAKVLITAHYDTCARLPFPNFMTPCSWPGILLTQGALLLGWMLLSGGAGFLLGRLMRSLAMPVWLATAVSMVAVLLVCAGLLALMLVGPANPHTANDNTSGVATVLMAMEALRGRDDIAYVLFDNEEKGLLGSAAFAQRHPAAAKRAFIVQYDCVSDGGTLLYTGSRAGMECAEGRRMAAALERVAGEHGRRVATGAFPKVIYPSDQMLFARGTAFAALRGERMLYLDRIHTARDTVFDEENLLMMVEVLEAFVRDKTEN